MEKRPCPRVWQYILGKVFTFEVRKSLHWDQELLLSSHWQDMSSLKSLEKCPYFSYPCSPAPYQSRPLHISPARGCLLEKEN